MRSTTIVIYHGNCADGFGAAWALRHGYASSIGRRRGSGDLKFIPGFYGKEPPDVTGKHVYLVDFSYKRSVLEEMAIKAKSITIIDHHKTAEADLSRVINDNVETIFDMTQSGAVLAWKYFNPHTDVPRLLQYVQDRDLWQFKLPYSREIAAALFSYSYDFDIWSGLIEQFEDERGFEQMRAAGAAIERKHFKDIAELLGVSARRMILGGYEVPVANLPYTMSSDAGHLLSKDQPFAACYIDRMDDRMFSLRSAPEGVDVSKVAASYGGGGHKNAAGFQAPLGWEGDNDGRFIRDMTTGHLSMSSEWVDFVERNCVIRSG